jgi:hypothetical protein
MSAIEANADIALQLWLVAGTRGLFSSRRNDTREVREVATAFPVVN